MSQRVELLERKYECRNCIFTQTRDCTACAEPYCYNFSGSPGPCRDWHFHFHPCFASQRLVISDLLTVAGAALVSHRCIASLCCLVFCHANCPRTFVTSYDEKWFIIMKECRLVSASFTCSLRVGWLVVALVCYF